VERVEAVWAVGVEVLARAGQVAVVEAAARRLARISPRAPQLCS
jgi:hypothetical protein